MFNPLPHKWLTFKGQDGRVVEGLVLADLVNDAGQRGYKVYQMPLFGGVSEVEVWAHEGRIELL